MKKNVSKFLCSALALVLTTASVFTVVGCKKKPTENNNNQNNEKVVNPNHDFSYRETDNYIVKNGQTEYKIVIPSGEVSKELVTAKDELVRLFKEATGCTLDCVTDGNASHNAQNKYISLGDTSLLRSTDMSAKRSELKKDGLKITTKDQTVYIYSPMDVGVIYGVYDFLSLNFGFEPYYTDCYTLDTGVKNLKLKEFSVTDIPDIEYRQKKGFLNSTTTDYNDMVFSYRMRSQDSYGDMFLPIHLGDPQTTSSNSTHNSFFFFPESDYKETNPNFYSDTGLQLCFTAHGEEEELNEMIDICVSKIETSLKWYTPEKYPQYVGVQLGINDFYSLCKCDACERESNAHNGAKSAAIIKFLNRVGEKVNAWMDKEENAKYKRENFKYVFLAYSDALQSPFRNYTTGEWNVNPDLTSPEGVLLVPFVAQDKFLYCDSLYSTRNQGVKRYVEDWASVYKDCMAWSYGTFFADYLCFYDSFGFYSQYYKLLTDSNYMFSFVQIHDCQRGSDTGFGALHSYLCYKLAWDSSLDANELIKKYFDAMYKDASEEMQELFLKEKLWFASENSKATMSTSDSITTDTNRLSFGTVKGFMNTLDKAYAKIETYKKDVDNYQKLKDHIDMEYIFPSKVMLSNYRENFTSEEYQEIKANFKNIAHRLGFAVIVETWLGRTPTTIDEFLDTLA